MKYSDCYDCGCYFHDGDYGWRIVIPIPICFDATFLVGFGPELNDTIQGR